MSDEMAVTDNSTILWESDDDMKSKRIYSVAGGIGIVVNGHGIVMPIERWHALAVQVDPATCRHLRKDGIGSAGSDGSSSFTGYCMDCGKDLSYKIEGVLADPMLQLQSKN